MREVKFRVFDKDFKRMHIVGKNSHDSFTCWDGQVQYYNLQNGEGSGEHGSYILMQYTGLKDKNGKEIYEGDVIEWIDRPLSTDVGEVIKDVVIFENGGFRTKKYNELISNLTVGRNGEPIFLEHHQTKIIGNRFEHPHLLEEST